jgi:hypothetical protein
MADADQLIVTGFTAAVGFAASDALDRFLATYSPSATGAPPTDKFTSTGAGTLANTLNVASAPNATRIAAGVAATALPAIGAAVTGEAALKGAALGAGIKLFSTIWSNVIMPLFTPKDTSVGSLQKNLFVRLYPAEVAAHINLHSSPPMTALTSSGSGALSDSPAYPDVGQALRTGVSESQWPSLQNTWGTGGPHEYETAAQVLRRRAGLGAGPPAASTTTEHIANAIEKAASVPPHQAATAAAAATSSPHDVHAALTTALPATHPAVVEQIAKAVEPHVRVMHGLPAWQPGPPVGNGPGPQLQSHASDDCGCLGDDPTIGFAGVLGAPPDESDPSFSWGDRVVFLDRS